MVLTCQRDVLASSLQHLQVFLQLLHKLRGNSQVQQSVPWLCVTGSKASVHQAHSAACAQCCSEAKATGATAGWPATVGTGAHQGQQRQPLCSRSKALSQVTGKQTVLQIPDVTCLQQAPGGLPLPVPLLPPQLGSLLNALLHPAAAGTACLSLWPDIKCAT